MEAYLKNELPEEEKLKYEIAQELGVLDKVLEGGWKACQQKKPAGSADSWLANVKKMKDRTQKKTLFGCCSGRCFFVINKNDMFRIYPQAETYYTEQQKTGENYGRYAECICKT